MKVVLLGRVATMDAAGATFDSGAVYVDGQAIAAVGGAGQPPPDGFEGAPRIDTQGTIFPGLIELHNHLSYDALPMWRVPKLFTNRNQWQSNSDYTSKVSGPMGVIARSNDPHVLAALARYVETKCLLGGVTSSQGISLKGDHLETYYHGALRVVDDPADHLFPRASTHIPDVAATDWTSFKKTVDKASCLLLHLSEGLDAKARDAFLALQQGGRWAIGPALAGIHCAALQLADFQVLAAHGGSMIWSPFSNLMLYGGTSRVKDARAAGVKVALGSDWSPSGSKNLLNELKIAKAVNDAQGLGLSDRDIVAMATSSPAAIVKWDKLVGVLAPGRRADLTVIRAGAGLDPYAALIAARETDVVLVMIDGRPVVGAPALMAALGAMGETLQVGGLPRVIDYGPGDPRTPFMTFAEARAALADALRRIPTLLADEQAGHGVIHALSPNAAAPHLRLALDEQHLGGFALRPRLPLHGAPTGPDASPVMAAAAATHPVLAPIDIDPVTVVDDPHYAANLRGQANIPAPVQAALLAYYS